MIIYRDAKRDPSEGRHAHNHNVTFAKGLLFSKFICLSIIICLSILSNLNSLYIYILYTSRPIFQINQEGGKHEAGFRFESELGE